MQAQIIIDRFLRSDFSAQYNLNVYEKILLVMLASYAGANAECFPSHIALSVDCSISMDSVKRYTRSLEKKQLINIRRSYGINNYYRLSIPSAATTECLQHPALIASPTQSQQHLSPGADSTTNNISNNINEYTLVTNLKKPRAIKKNKSIFPEKMEVNDMHKLRATEYGLDVNEEFQHFKEYNLAKGNTYSSWDLSFCVWLRNARKFSQKNINQVTSNIKDWI
ncbi:MAG: helix-turn-helix domain-containing protein [Gammaproteobacteria bacterium]